MRIREYDLYIFYLIQNGLTKIRTQTFLGDNIKLCFPKGILKYIAGIDKIEICFLTDIEIY